MQWVDGNAGLTDMEDWDTFPSPDQVIEEHPESELSQLADGLNERSVVFPILHGPFGEDGVIQGHLEALGVPYVGAGVLSSSICMDKAIAKSLLRDHGIPVAPWCLLRRHDARETIDAAATQLGFPLFVKPANLGSSIGVTKVHEAAKLHDAVALAFEFDDHIVLEEFVRGRELELAMLGNEDNIRITAAGEIVASREFYDYEDKYLLGVAKTIVPSDLHDDQLAKAKALARRAVRALRVEGLARVDLFLGEDGSFIVNEVNTMPGFTPISMYPALWEAAGIPFGELVDTLVDLGVARHARRKTLRTHR
jgi:D-alanine-D-alanine ligase